MFVIHPNYDHKSTYEFIQMCGFAAFEGDFMELE